MTTQIVPLRDGIIFQFEQEVTRRQGSLNRTQFIETTQSGIQFSTFDHSLKTPRWIKIIATGVDCTPDIKVGDRALIEPLKWSDGFSNNGETYWKTDPKQIILIDDSAIL